MNFLIPKSWLPYEPRERQARLERYFSNRSVKLSDAGPDWAIFVGPPAAEGYYVDPRLMEGLRWYSKRFAPVEEHSVPLACHRATRYQISLDDSWTLWSWSRWLEGRTPSTTEVTILHADDHDDLMTPALVIRDGWFDAWTGEAFSMEDPLTVEGAIASGAVGIGSFIAPFIRSVRRVDFRHLRAREYATNRRGVYRLLPFDVPDTLLHPSSMAPGVRREPAEPGEDPDRRYSVTTDPTEWVNSLRPGPVLLHIDMDYFNDRFDGSSYWRDSGAERYDPTLDAVIASVDSVAAVLRRVGRRFEDTTIALSPGFFPAELWEPSISVLEEQLPL